GSRSSIEYLCSVPQLGQKQLSNNSNNNNDDNNIIIIITINGPIRISQCFASPRPSSRIRRDSFGERGREGGELERERISSSFFHALREWSSPGGANCRLGASKKTGAIKNKKRKIHKRRQRNSTAGRLGPVRPPARRRNPRKQEPKIKNKS